MGILANLFNRVQKKSSQNSPPANLVVSTQPILLDPKSKLIQLEEQLKQESSLQVKPVPQLKRNWRSKLIWISALVGIPVGILYVINLPYPAIRRPISATAPFLLLPSQISIDNNFKRSLEFIEQAEQLIENPTSASDIELGFQRLQEGKVSLNAIPLNSVDEWIDYGGYGWRFSRYRFQQIREQVGRLEAKVFQEKNAQALLVEGEEEIRTAKIQFQQAETSAAKKIAIRSWESAFDKFRQIPNITWAGRNAQQKLTGYEREFNELVGLNNNSERVSTLITSAQQFSRQARLISQNPPYTIDQWQEIEKLWQLSIDDLKQIPQQDLAGYAEARKLIAEYTATLGQITVKRRAEEKSLLALENAQQSIEILLANTPNDIKAFNRNLTISRLQSIINNLDKVENGTTSYPKSQELKLFAKNKLQQLLSTN